MTFNEALNKLSNKYEKYGFSKEMLSEQLQDGVMNQGFSLNMTYNGLRMALGSATGQEELFSVDDVVEISGLSRDEVLQEIEKARNELVAAGENPDDYFKPVEPKNKSVFYFPGGLSDLTS
ncbi:hypothetical protein [Blautia sp. XA-2221]|uniref:hypothetical protein n=1 Tax=Blautia sp. XA-2221 TaxID=2903961 RepID=UPI0023793DED|nr:hypothetical protein [Blautia sp. XA-2221]